MRLIYFAAFLLWATDPAGAQTKFNPYTGQWQLAPANATPQYNPYSGKFEMAARHPDSIHIMENGRSPLQILLRVTTHSGKWELAPSAVPSVRGRHRRGS
jgi:hypothetical protein